MELSHNVLVTLAAVLSLYACLVASLPAARSSSVGPGEDANEDFRHLVNLLGNMKSADSRRNSELDSWGFPGERDLEGKLDSPSGQVEKLAQVLKQGVSGYNKRNRSYDYGLGGGRFGKRYYGDYGIGGGRFGRDVDHVDIADTSDVTL